MKINKYLFLATSFLFFVGCEEKYTPKPRDYYRISLPQNEYQFFNEKNYPYAFSYSKHAQIKPIEEKGQQYWIDVQYPFINADIHLSYKKLNGDLKDCIRSTLSYINIHQSKASGIREIEYNFPEQKKYGIVYEILGKEVASTYQFYLTDSNQNFIRGAVYINCKANNDSLSPVLHFLRKDLEEMIESFDWK